MSVDPVPTSRPWRLVRRSLLALAIVATLVAVFYAEENLRGKYAWNQCRQQLEKQGAALDWAAYIPLPVPDASNVFKAPFMTDWFVRSTPTLNAPPSEHQKALRTDVWSGHPSPGKFSNDLLVAEITIVPANAQPDSRQGDVLLQFGDPATREQAGRLLRDTVGPTCARVVFCDFMARPAKQIKPVHVLLAADTPPDRKQIATLFPTNALALDYSRLDVQPAGTNEFRAWLRPPPLVAAEFLAANQPAERDFELMRQALQRPFARLDGNDAAPIERPIPDFITVRMVAQTLAERTECHLLLNQPEAALRELALLHELRVLLEGRPPDKSIMLAAAMIDVAVTGLYTSVIASGLRLHAWQEPQLIELQRQLNEIDLLAPYRAAVQSQGAALCRTLEITPPSKLASLFFVDSRPEESFWRKVTTGRYWATWGPHGWVYQNMANIATQREKVVQALDSTNCIVHARQLDAIFQQSEAARNRFSPYTILATLSVPNYFKAATITALNQTKVKEALLACALERYHMSHGGYPETLAALMPEYLDKEPSDVITGQPLKYRRIAEGSFILYSTGWNGIDDGGLESRAVQDGDWVWRTEP